MPITGRDHVGKALGLLLSLDQCRTPEAIGGLVAALGDEAEQFRWCVALLRLVTAGVR